MKKDKAKKESRSRRKLRVRRKIRGTAARPRMSVYRSLRHVYVQLIDDDRGSTILAVSTASPGFKERHPKSGGTVEAARVAGEMIGQLAQQRNVKEAVFDRGRYRFHGRVKALADAARKEGLKI